MRTESVLTDRSGVPIFFLGAPGHSLSLSANM